MKRTLKKITLFLFLAALAGCAQRELVKGDVLRVEKKVLAQSRAGFRLVLLRPGELAVRRVGLCPVRERKIYEEVKVTRSSAAIAGVSKIGCGIQKLGEISTRVFGQGVERPSNCGGASFTDRRPTGKMIPTPWVTVRHEVCGIPQKIPAGGQLRIQFPRSRDARTYRLGPGGTFRLDGELLGKLRLYLTLLENVQVEATYGGYQWQQKINLE